jgi:hypothetical protein
MALFFDLATAAPAFVDGHGAARWSSLGGDGRRRRCLPAAFTTTEGAGGSRRRAAAADQKVSAFSETVNRVFNDAAPTGKTRACYRCCPVSSCLLTPCSWTFLTVKAQVDIEWRKVSKHGLRLELLLASLGRVKAKSSEGGAGYLMSSWRKSAGQSWEALPC